MRLWITHNKKQNKFKKTLDIIPYEKALFDLSCGHTTSFPKACSWGSDCLYQPGSREVLAPSDLSPGVHI